MGVGKKQVQENVGKGRGQGEGMMMIENEGLHESCDHEAVTLEPVCSTLYV
jgi:hypothetical protein